MNIKQIRYFISVVERGSLSAAAKDQQVTVQAVSKAIADLERELGRDLFVRESRGVSPTPFGHAFYQKADPVNHGFQSLEAFSTEYLEQKRQMAALHLALIAPPFYRNEEARASIATFVRRGLGIDTAVDIAYGEDGMKLLYSGELDALITIGSYANPDIDCVSIGTVSPGVIMSTNHPLAQKEVVCLDDLCKYPLLSSPSVEHFNDTIATRYRSRHVELEFIEPSREEADRFIHEENALFFAAGIPALGELYPETVMRLVKSDDAVAIPICLVTLKKHKSASYLALDRWLKGAMFFPGVNMFGSDS